MCLAIPGKIESIDDADALMRQAKVSFGGIKKDVSLALLPEAQVNQYVLVHAGVAIGVIDEAEAAQVFSYLEEIGDLEELKGDTS